MKSKTKIEYRLEWRAVWPEPSWEPAGRFVNPVYMRAAVKKMMKDGNKVRVTKIVSERTIHTPKGWKNSLE